MSLTFSILVFFEGLKCVKENRETIPFGVIRDFKFGGFTGSFPVGLPRARRRTAVQATVSVALMIKTYQ